MGAAALASGAHDVCTAAAGFAGVAALAIAELSTTGVSGWVVYKGKLEVDAAAEHSGAEVQDLDAKMDQAAINAALLCAPITSG